MESVTPQYVFTRDRVDNNRWIELFGYRLHPHIPLVGPQHRIADIGTGTGIWLTDLSTRIPTTVQLDGLDISLEATPPAQWVPSNVSFFEWDIRQDVPEKLVGQYDIVHIRLFIFVLLEKEIPGVLQKLTMLLKPGGYLQWDEVDISSLRIAKAHPDNKIEALTRPIELSSSQRPVPAWAPKLAGLAESAGLSDINAEKRDAPGYLAFAMHECNLVLHELMARATGNEAFAKGLEQLMPEVTEETRKGASWDFTRWTVVARRPVQ
ncbi:hypothetical protein M426DRAFT_264618 [Hypoxylon sp. CI-4A]|nr:hypothetical protein M426DRAFT_264618 [Hypoxylon sp. CI-4A]